MAFLRKLTAQSRILTAKTTLWLILLSPYCPNVTSSTPKIELSSGFKIPVIGYGTWAVEPKDVDHSLPFAIENGYTYVDTAFTYGSEKPVGKYLEEYFQQGGKREDLFIAARLPPFGNSASDVERYLRVSLKNLHVDYLDLYSIGLPWGMVKDIGREEEPLGFSMHPENRTCVLDFNTDLLAIWKAMESQVEAGLVRSLGLNNVNASQIERVAKASKITPSIAAVEGYLYHQQRQLRKLATEYKIALVMHSPLGAWPIVKMPASKKSPSMISNPMEDPVVLEIARNHGKTAAQVLLRHLVQESFIVLPDTSDLEELRSNMDIFDFDLTEDELFRLDNLDRGEAGRLWDSYNLPGVEVHPEYPYPT